MVRSQIKCTFRKFTCCQALPECVHVLPELHVKVQHLLQPGHCQENGSISKTVLSLIYNKHTFVIKARERISLPAVPVEQLCPHVTLPRLHDCVCINRGRQLFYSTVFKMIISAVGIESNSK